MRYLLMAKGSRYGQWKKLVVNIGYDHRTSYKNKDYKLPGVFLPYFIINVFVSVCVCALSKHLFLSTFIPLLYNIRCIDFVSLYLSIVNFTSQYLNYRISRTVNITQGPCIHFWGKGQYVLFKCRIVVSCQAEV